MRRQARLKRQQAVLPGTVALLCAGSARYTQVVQCFNALEAPEGTERHIYCGGPDQSSNRNDIIRSCRGDWLLMIDDDQIFAPDLLMRLLRHFHDLAVDIVAPLILRRRPPHDTVMGNAPAGDDQPPPPIELTTQRGLLPVHVVGSGILLMRRRVFERIEQPWFERHPQLSEDYYFCIKAQAVGCGVFCDLETRAGHILPMVVWPSRLPGGNWGSSYTTLTVGVGDDVVLMVTEAEHQTRRPGPGATVHTKKPRRSRRSDTNPRRVKSW
jgi:hypothetical protein